MGVNLGAIAAQLGQAPPGNTPDTDSTAFALQGMQAGQKMQGISALQGGHQVAQKFNIKTLPGSELRSWISPVRSESLIAGNLTGRDGLLCA